MFLNAICRVEIIKFIFFSLLGILLDFVCFIANEFKVLF